MPRTPLPQSRCKEAWEVALAAREVARSYGDCERVLQLLSQAAELLPKPGGIVDVSVPTPTHEDVQAAKTQAEDALQVSTYSSGKWLYVLWSPSERKLDPLWSLLELQQHGLVLQIRQPLTILSVQPYVCTPRLRTVLPIAHFCLRGNPHSTLTRPP
jgi:hypothetical protein